MFFDSIASDRDNTLHQFIYNCFCYIQNFKTEFTSEDLLWIAAYMDMRETSPYSNMVTVCYP